MEGPITTINKTLVEVQDESETNQQSRGDCLGAEFVSALPELVHLELSRNKASELRDLWEQWSNGQKNEFTHKYGDIALLLYVKVDPHFLRAIVNFWDPSYRCFVFNREDLTPTLEEYTTLLQIPSAYKIYSKKPHHASISKKLSKIMGIDASQRIPVQKKETNISIPWLFLQNHIAKNPDDPRTIDIFALAIYGLVIFPKVTGYIEASVVDLFERLGNNINPASVILAETIRSLNHCRRTGKGHITGCIQLLYVWARSHFWKGSDLKRRLFRNDFSPLAEFSKIDWPMEWNKKQWIQVLRHLSREDITWRAPWMRPESFLYSCGNYPWVPLMGIWGVVSYAPLLVRRQYGSQQFIPMTQGLNQMEFSYGEHNAISKVRDIVTAWKRRTYSEVGVYSAKLTPKYRVWRAARIQDVVLPPEDPSEGSVSFRPQTVMLSEMEILKQDFEIERRRMGDENKDLQGQVGQLKIDSEVQTAQIRKFEKEKNAIIQDSKRLRSEEETLTTKEILRKHKKELDRARKEAGYWEDKAREKTAKYSAERAKYSATSSKLGEYAQENEILKTTMASERAKWEDLHSATSSKIERYAQENEKLKTTIASERIRSSQVCTENDSLREAIHTLGNELRSQKEDIMVLLEAQQEKENELIRSLFQTQDDCDRWAAESQGRQYYIDHLTEEIQKAVSKAGKMIEKVEELRSIVNPTGRYGQRLLRFLAEAQDQYEQIRRFYGYNTRMMGNV